MKQTQYGAVIRVLALILGTTFLSAAIGAFFAALLVRGLPLWIAVLSVPFAGLGWLLFSAGRIGEDPEWLYNALDVPEHEIGEDRNG